MRRGLALFFALGVTLMNFDQAGAQADSTVARHAPVHVENTFRFEVAAPMARVAPLFAPEAERAWAGAHWNPVFVYPQPGRDIQGAVFTVQHGAVKSVWVNTLFDVRGGRMEYVAVFGDHFTMTVEVRVTAVTPSRTAVVVTYARTALDPAANDDVRALGESDRTSGPDWQSGIEAALGLKK